MIFLMRQTIETNLRLPLHYNVLSNMEMDPETPNQVEARRVQDDEL